MEAEPSAMSMKSGDNWAVPLCSRHHRELHDIGDEKAFFAKHGFRWDRIMSYAADLWKKYKN